MPYAESLRARTAPTGQVPSQMTPEQVTPEVSESLVTESGPAVRPPVPDEAPGGQTPQAQADSSAEQGNGAETAAPAQPVQQAPEAVAGGPEGAADPAAPQPSADASPAPGEDTCLAELVNTRRPYCQDRLASGGDGPPMVILPTGAFDMGDDQTTEASPRHRVTIVQPIAMSLYEVSFAEFRIYCSASGQTCPQRPWEDDDYPVVGVSWSEAGAYADWLSAETGYGYRLPTEAEWEYAARAGSDSPYPFGTEVTPSAARSSAGAPVDTPLGRQDQSVNRNDFRLFHMAGNVREWVGDAWHDSYQGAPADASAWEGGAGSQRVVRGGSYADAAPKLQSAAREPLEASGRDSMTGFRLVRNLER